MTDNVKDIFTKKDLSEIEAKKQQDIDEHEEALRFNLQQLIDQQQELLDTGNLTGIAFFTTTKTGYTTPVVEWESSGDIIKMNMLADMLKDRTIGECTLMSIPDDFEYDED